MLKRIACCVIIGLFVVGLFAGIGSATNVRPDFESAPVIKAKYTPHNPIRINSDTEFTTQFHARVISGYEINGMGKGFCIYIGNCTRCFIVKNCYLHNASGKYNDYFKDTGLYLYNSINGIFLNNTCSMNRDYGIYLSDDSNTNILADNNCSENENSGIYIKSSSTNTLTNNTCNKNDIGIDLDNSNNNTLTNNNCNGNLDGIIISFSNVNTLTGNNCSENTQVGISLHASKTNTLKQNKMYGCGMSIDGSRILHYNTYRIDTTNLVNGKPVYYLKNQSGGIIPPDAGQVIIANCSHITVDKQTMINCSQSILVAYSNNCTFSNNNCSENSWYGIYLDHSDTNTLTNNTCNRNSDSGISLRYSNTNKLTGNTYIGNKENAIQLVWYSCTNTLTNNHCTGNLLYGFYLENSNTNTLTNNICSMNYGGIYLFYSNSNTLANNTFQGNTKCGVSIDGYGTMKNRIYHNNFINNSIGGKQGYDNSGKNFWNTSTEGNYWSDWTSPDANGDGIVDNPYLLGGGMNAKDFYPLTASGRIYNFIIYSIIIAVIIIIVIVTIAIYFWRKRKSTPTIPVKPQDSNKPQL